MPRKPLTAKYDAMCPDCNLPIKAGAKITLRAGKAHHDDCAEAFARTRGEKLPTLNGKGQGFLKVDPITRDLYRGKGRNYKDVV